MSDGSQLGSKFDIIDVEAIQLKARSPSEGSERHGSTDHPHRPRERRF